MRSYVNIQLLTLAFSTLLTVLMLRMSLKRHQTSAPRVERKYSVDIRNPCYYTSELQKIEEVASCHECNCGWYRTDPTIAMCCHNSSEFAT